MGDKNQALYLSKYVPECEGRILEIGSKDYGNTASFRDHYDYEEYVGIDMEDGDGVDAVVDLVAGTGSLEKNYFDLAICCSVIEHVNRPWIFADNLSSLIKPGGLLYISAPWVWRYHPYPDDYWRFSWRGVEQIGHDIGFTNAKAAEQVRTLRDLRVEVRPIQRFRLVFWPRENLETYGWPLWMRIARPGQELVHRDRKVAIFPAHCLFDGIAVSDASESSHW